MTGMRLTLWAAAAIAAVGVGAAAVSAANPSDGGDEVLSQDDVAQQLADGTPGPGSTPGSPADPSTPGPDPAGAGEPITLSSQAGQLVAWCDGDLAYLETWSPNPGYRVDDVVRGPAATVSVWLESDSFDDVELIVQCEAGTPQLTELVEPDDHGGDRDRDDRDDHDDDRSGPGGGDRDDRDDRYDN